MSMQKQFWIWAGLLGAAFLLLFVFRGILLPFVVGMALAYLLDPVADLLEKIKFNRFWATSLVMLVVVAIFLSALLLVVPAIIQQIIGLAQQLPDYVSQLQIFANDRAPEIYDWLGKERIAQFENSLSSMMSNWVAIVGNLSGQVMQSGLTLINMLGLLIVSPVVAFYLLLDWDRMVKTVDDLLPLTYRDEIRQVFFDMDRAMAGVIRGQGSVVLLLALFYSIALTLAGLDFGLAIGVSAGLLSFIPYIGFLVGFVLSVGVAIVQYWPDGLPIWIIVGIFLVGQFLEGNVLYPKLVGSSIGVHPVWLMFSLFAVGILFGFVGLLLAVPLVAIIGVLVRFVLGKYINGPLYLGEQAQKEQTPPASKEQK
ncbi:Putative permease often clustered with de novo purine synthesis [hydrothermal vent metagenome]|uniref:Permease often clustered with de novo purine synthesis n=1 Tax=hydrothermal vent metagenome TaxID=652676 RepID=A0A3B0TLE2_9ZZZZ